MKKTFARILSVVLFAAMLISLVPMMPVAKADTNDTIVWTNTGSIIVHKYEFNGTPGTPASPTFNGGTGETSDMTSNPLDHVDDTPPVDTSIDPAPLGGCEFTIYQVKDADALKELYKGVSPAPWPVLSDYVTANGDGTYTVTALAGSPVDSDTTTPAGVATFSGLELGVYLVVETAQPDKVTTIAAPFLVSIPMTKVNGSEWMYEVNVYPKNKSTYGQITIQKQGKTDTELLSGVTFKLEKETAPGTWTSVTVNDQTREEYSPMTTAPITGKLTVTGLSQGHYRFIETDLGAANRAAGYILDGTMSYGFVVDANGNVTPDSDTQPFAGTTLVDPTATAIVVKNYKADIKKQVQDNDGDYHEAADHSIGDVLTYQLTIDVPENFDKLEFFKVTDIPTRITDKADTVKLVKYGAAVADFTLDATQDGDGFVVDLKEKINTSVYDIAGKKIVIEYNAVLKPDAVMTDVGNPNTVKLTYNNKIGSTTDIKEIEDEALVFTFELDINKTFEGFTGTSKSGVKFELYKDSVAPANLIHFTAGTSGNFTVASTGTVTEVVTDADGMIRISGLENGTYKLVETQTLAGYNLLAEPVTVTMNVTYNATWDETGTSTETLNRHHLATDGAGINGDVTNSGEGKVQGVVNRKGFTLPQTGSMGYLLFCATGIILVGCGSMLMLSGRKRKIR